MKNYFEKLERRVQKYKTKYANRPRKAAFKLALWNTLCVFKRHKRQDIVDLQSITKPVNKIALAINGGIGDYITAINYAAYLYNFLNKQTPIDIFVKNPKSMKTLFSKSVNFDFFERDSIHEKKEYPLKLNLNRFPEILYCNETALHEMMPNVIPLLNAWEKIKKEAGLYFEIDPRADALTVQYAQVNGAKKRIQQPDIDGILGVKQEHLVKLYPENKTEILKKFGLNDCVFITMNRGTDTGNKDNEVTRMWPLENYAKLVKLIKDKYPRCKIVQLGYSPEWCRLIDGIDIDLRGKTTLFELKSLLFASALHIDYEGGMVHLRKALGVGKSIVLFGPTNPNWLGYDTNINICTNKCCFCENLTPNWQKYCSNHKFPHICMESITPEMVFNKVNAVLSSVKSRV